MYDPLGGFSAMGLALIVFLALVGTLWVLLPFAVFGLKPRIDSMLTEQRAANRILERIADRLDQGATGTPAADDAGQTPPS